jgi:hypothetical protein
MWPHKRNVEAVPAPFESLEDRRMLTAASIASTTVRDTDWLIVVRYTDPLGVNVATLDNNDINVTGPQGYSKHGTFVSFVQDAAGSNASVRAVYSVPSLGTAWSYASSGSYAVTMLPNAVTNINGDPVAPSTLGTFGLFFSTPKAEIISAFTTDTQFIVNIKYSDNVGISPTSIGFGEVGLARKSNPNNVQFFRSQTYTQNADGSWNVQYRLPAYGGSWDWTDDDTYMVNIRGNAVHDTETPTHFIPAQTLGSFFLWFDNPHAELVSQNVTATDWLVTVKYTDNTGIDASTIGDGDISAANGIITVLGVRVTPTAEAANAVTVTYSVHPSHFAWGNGDNGTYALSVLEGQVKDDNGVGIHAAELGRFFLFFDQPSISKPVNLANPTPTGWTFSVIYTDNDVSPVLQSTVGNGDLRMEGPNGYKQNATLVEKHTATVNGKTVVVATYKFTPSSGNFQNGTYNIFVNPNQVGDTTNHFISEFLWGSFFLFF